MSEFWDDCVSALCVLWRSPRVPAAVALTLGLAAGLNGAVFTVVNAVLLKPLPYRAPEQLVTVERYYRDETRFTLSFPELNDLRAMKGVFQGAAGLARDQTVLSYGNVTAQVQMARVTADFFTILGAEAVAGELFRESDARDERGRVLLLSEQAWRTLFASDPRVMGRRARLLGPRDDQPTEYTIIGVANAEVGLPAKVPSI